MPYDYQTERAKIFTEEGQKLFLAIRDETSRLLRIAGAARVLEIIKMQGGDTWLMLACIDRLVELGEIRELTGPECSAQARVFTTPLPG